MADHMNAHSSGGMGMHGAMMGADDERLAFARKPTRVPGELIEGNVRRARHVSRCELRLGADVDEPSAAGDEFVRLRAGDFSKPCQREPDGEGSRRAEPDPDVIHRLLLEWASRP
jgi:hypothetical protein